MEHTDNPFNGLEIRRPQAKYGDGSIKQKAFFEHGSHESNSIPLEERIEILAKFVFEGYDIHKLVESYLDDKDALEDDKRRHNIARTFKAYANEIFFEPKTKDWRKGVIELLIGDEDKTSSEQMWEAIEAFIEVVNVHLKRENFIKPSQVPVYLIRMNYYQKDAYNVDKLIDDLYENNIISINVRDKKDKKDGNNENDEKIINDLRSGNKEHVNTPNYIKQFCNIEEKLKKDDVIVVAYYLDKNPKIGLIKKDSEVFCKEETGEVYKLYCLQMKNAHRISGKTKNLLDTLIPVGNTITPVIKRASVIHSIYYEMPLPFELSSLTDSNLEILCAEYLRYFGLSLKSKVLGGTFPDIDIIGYNNQNELFAAQVSSAENQSTIDKKIEKLCPFEKAKHKILFSTRPSNKNSDYLNINIQDVWNDFAKDKFYEKFLKRLIEF